MSKQQLPRAVRRQIREAKKTAREHGLAYDQEDQDALDAAEVVVEAQAAAAAASGISAPAMAAAAGEPAYIEPNAEDAEIIDPDLELEVGEPVAPASVTEDDDQWRERYRALQGKYNTEMPRMQRQMQETNARLDSVQSEYNKAIAFINSGSPATVPTPTPTNGGKRPLSSAGLSQEEIDEYGEDLLSVVGRVADAQFQPHIQRLEAENVQLHEALAKVGTNTVHVAQNQKKDDVRHALTSMIPDWKDTNRSQGFNDWLAQFDPMMNSTKKDALTHAFQQGDVNRVAAFFEGYTRAGGGQPALAPAHAPQVDLTAVAAPASSAGRGQASTVGDLSQHIWTPAGVKDHYAAVQRGDFVGKEAEQRRIEQDMVKAPMENRYRV